MSAIREQIDAAVRRLTKRSGFKHEWWSGTNGWTLVVHGRETWPDTLMVSEPTKGSKLVHRARSGKALLAWIEARL